MTFDLGAVGSIDKLEKRIARLESLEGSPAVGRGFTLIDEVVLTDSLQTSVELGPIPGIFQSLCLLLSVRYVGNPLPGPPTRLAPLHLRMNGDSGANYDWGNCISDVVLNYTTGLLDTEIELGWITCLGAGNDPDYFTSLEGWIVHYKSSDKITPITWMSGSWASALNGASAWADYKGSGHWRDTDAITSLTFLGGAFEENSKFSLYGIGE